MTEWLKNTVLTRSDLFLSHFTGFPSQKDQLCLSEYLMVEQKSGFTDKHGFSEALFTDKPCDLVVFKKIKAVTLWLLWLV